MIPLVMDAGPLVAWCCPKDTHHVWARETFGRLPTGGLTCEAVLAEACHLVAKDGVAPATVLEFVERGGLVLVSLAGEVRVVRQLMDRYRDIGMDFGDACAVRLAEMREGSRVCTVDTDFRVYRCHGTQPIPLVAPFA